MSRLHSWDKDLECKKRKSSHQREMADFIEMRNPGHVFESHRCAGGIRLNDDPGQANHENHK